MEHVASVVCCSTGRAWELASGDGCSTNSVSRTRLLRKQVNDSGCHWGIGLADTVSACSVISQWRMRSSMFGGGMSFSHSLLGFSRSLESLDIAAVATIYDHYALYIWVWYVCVRSSICICICIWFAAENARIHVCLTL
jgi:hypothetical protein